MEDTRLIDWLMEAPTPSIRLLTLRHLRDLPEAAPEVMEAQQQVRAAGPVPAILAGQTETGNWCHERSYYTPKYTSTHWSMLLLAELAADGNDARMRRGAGHMLGATKDQVARAIEREECGLSCFWGNLLRYALHCGCADDPRVATVVRYLVHDAEQGGWRCKHNYGLPCAWGAARALWGLAALPPDRRTGAVEAAIQSGVTFLLQEHRLVEANYPPSDRVDPLWFRLNFPLFYQTDILFVLRVLAELGALGHPGAQPALEWLAARRSANGRWRGASPYRRRTWLALGDREETDRWVSLQAAGVLRQAGL